MNRDTYTFAAHATLDFANPFTPEAFGRVLALTDLKAGDAFVDIGAGKATLCTRLAARGVNCDAIERAPLMAAETRRRVADIRGTGSVRVHEEDAGAFIARVPDGHYPAAACIGSIHALGGLHQTLAALRRVVRPGGWALIGEGFWEQPPAAEYLAATGIESHEFTPLAGLCDAALAAGLHPDRKSVV